MVLTHILNCLLPVELEHLAEQSDNKQVRGQARGALWIIQDKASDRPEGPVDTTGK